MNINFLFGWAKENGIDLPTKSDGSINIPAAFDLYNRMNKNKKDGKREKENSIEKKGASSATANKKEAAPKKYKVNFRVVTEDELNSRGVDSREWDTLDDKVEGTSPDALDYDAATYFEENYEYGTLKDAEGNPVDLGAKSADKWEKIGDDKYEQWITYENDNGYKVYLIQRIKQVEE